MYAHDPSVLAQLALKDAQKAAKLRPQWAEVYACEVRENDPAAARQEKVHLEHAETAR